MAVKVSGKVPLRIVLVVPFVIQIFAVVGLTGWFSLRNGQKAVNEVAAQLRSETTADIRQQLNSYLEKPPMLNQINADIIGSGFLNLQQDLPSPSLQSYIWKQSLVFESVNTAAVATVTSSFLGFERQGDSSIQIVVSDRSTGYNLRSYATESHGRITKLLKQTPNFAPSTRPWYKAAVQAGKPTWSEIYASFSSKRLMITHSQPIYNNQGKLLGVTSASIRISQLNEFLNGLKIGHTGQTFVMERSGMLVGTSTGEKLFRTSQSQGTQEQERLKATDSSDPLTSATARYLVDCFGNFNRIRGSQQLNFEIDGRRAFLQVVPFQDRWGLDWLVVVVVPEADFMRQIDANTHSTILLCLAALILAILIGILTSRWVVQPILRLSDAATALSIGEWNQFVLVERDDELGTLARAFNRMAGQLREAFEELEIRVEERTAELQESETREREKAQRLEDTLHELQRTQAQLIQTEKMSSLGQLVAGVAHEINNPVNFIHGNLTYTNQYIQDILNLLHLYQQHYPNPVDEICSQAEAIEIEFLAGDLPKILTSMQAGTERIRQIVLSLRNFARVDQAEIIPVNIHEGLDSALLLLQNQLQGKADNSHIQVIPEYGDLPLVECYASQLNQVFMNIFNNAIYVLEECAGEILDSGSSPYIKIRTSVIDEEQVEIRIADNGPGMTEEVRSKLFDPFFTTKPVGQGTGLGLSVSYQIVVEKHGGQLQCISAPGQGAEFVILIPIHQKQ